jgi:hypothetical protein
MESIITKAAAFAKSSIPVDDGAESSDDERALLVEGEGGSDVEDI